jgi:hypothetical protein
MRTSAVVFKKNRLACFFGPLAIIPATIIYIWTINTFGPEEYKTQNGVGFLFVIVALFFAYILTLMVGLPVSLYLQRLGKFSLRNLLGIVSISAALFSILLGQNIWQFITILYFSFFVTASCWFFYSLE